ncbi:hypothetical protein ACF0H5_022399 [Mactra antiquata]
MTSFMTKEINEDNLNINNIGIDQIKADKPDDCAKRRLLVYTCDTHCGGWGDRQNGIITTFLLALLTNRIFVIEMNSPCQLENILDTHHYDWTMCKPFLTSGNLKSESIKTLNAVDALNVQSVLVLPVLEDNNNFQVIRVKTNVLIFDSLRKHDKSIAFIKLIQNVSNQAVMRIVLDILFKNKDTTLSQSNHFRKTILKGRKLVCTHVRKGKNPTIPLDEVFNTFRGSPNEETIFSFLKEYTDEQKYAIFVASDSDAVKTEALSLFPNCVSLNRTIIHIDRIGGEPKTVTSLCEGFETVIYEQYLLSTCDILVLTQSNFGFNAAFMRGSRDGLFVYITKLNKILPVNINNLWIARDISQL